jgi:hypothetical protein
MTIEQLRSIHGARPFRAFNIRTADGREIRVAHPDCLAMSQTGRTVVIVNPDDSLSMVDMLLVTELKVDPATVATA